MKYPTTEKIVKYIVDSYRKAGRAMGKSERRNGQLSSWMNQNTFDETADRIEAAYDRGEIDNVDESQLDDLYKKYGDSDIYHLAASYFNKTGRILNVVRPSA